METETKVIMAACGLVAFCFTIAMFIIMQDRQTRIKVCEKAEPNQVVLCLNTIK